jgi:hypothetical protein
MTPMDTALLGLLLVTPVPPVPPPQEASSVMSAARNAIRRGFMISPFPLASVTPTLTAVFEMRSRFVCADRTGLRRRRFDPGQIFWCSVVM